MTPLPRVILGPGREHTTAARHPWLFSGAVDRVEGSPADGDEVVLVDSTGNAAGRGLWNSRSQIRVRVYTTDPDEALDDTFWRGKVARALEVRRRVPDLDPREPVRLVFSEADGLSGMVVDRIGGWLVVQFTSLALHRRMEVLLDALEEAFHPEGIMLRTEKGILEEEGLELTDGMLRGHPPEGPVTLADGSLRMLADLRTGQKTGFYLDQRWNRRAVARWAEGRRAADICTYSGGFALHLGLGGAASVVGVDVSASALELAGENARLNGMDDRLRWVRSDAAKWLEGERGAGSSYDLIVLDPPRFARSRRGVPGALRGYGRLNEAAVRVLEPGGILATFSCSGRVTREAFSGVLAEVAGRTGRRLRILETLGQPADHPVDPNTPETAYLKGFILQVE
ncbi:23S rRNA (cytosine(1962)-C(5))-methyltransferase RlmI [soil metagenome]